MSAATDPRLHDYVFTFGCGINDPHRNGYHIVRAYSWEGARHIMNERFGDRWAFQYPSKAAAGVEQFGLHEVPWKASGDADAT